MGLEQSLDHKNFSEKILQFGTGVLMRGLCDHIIHQELEKGNFDGKIVVVKSTPGSVQNFKKQNNLYTHFIKGVKDGKLVDKVYINESISRVLEIEKDWEKVKAFAQSESLSIIISNTTEVGIEYKKEKITENIPLTFPARLTALLFYRFKANMPGVLVVPTELINENGKLLEKYVHNHVKDNNLGKDFLSWLKENVSFCNSLVDRIVPGKPNKETIESLDYKDELAIVSEPYALWAIEGNENVSDSLGFADFNESVIVQKDISKYKNLKLHLLNAPHTLMSGMAFLSGFKTVYELMSDEIMEKYMTILLLTELSVSVPGGMDAKITQRYGRQILDRFRNPYIEHNWIDITLNYTLKMKTRCIPLLLNYYDIFGNVPHYFARCFASYLLFMRPAKKEGDQYFGQFNSEYYPLKCSSANLFNKAWKSNDPKLVTEQILGDTKLWDEDLRTLPNFRIMVETHLSNMMIVGVKDVASALNVFA